MTRAVLCAVAALAVSVGVVRGVQAKGWNYLQFWTIGRAMPLDSYDRLHRKDLPREVASDPAIVRPGAVTPKLFLTATPLYYTAFAVTAGPDFRRSLHLFQIASVAVFLPGLIFVLRAWGYSTEAIALVIAACFFLSAPFYEDTRYGNVTRVFVGLMALLLWAVRRRTFVLRTAGAQALLALLVLFKPFLALAFPALLLLRLVAGRWRTGVYEIGGFVMGTLLGLLLPGWLVGAPMSLWVDFWGINTRNIEGGDYSRGFDASLVERLTDVLHLSFHELAAIVAVVCIAAVAIVVAIVIARAPARPSDAEAEVEDADLAVLLSAAVFVLLSPLVWPFYYLLSMVVALFLLRDAQTGTTWSRLRFITLIAALLLVLAFPLATVARMLLPTGVLEPDAAINAQLALGNALVCAVGVLEYGRRVWRACGELLGMRLKVAVS